MIRAAFLLVLTRFTLHLEAVAFLFVRDGQLPAAFSTAAGQHVLPVGRWPVH